MTPVKAAAAPAGVDATTTASTEAPLSTTPLALRRDGTIRGEAFDNAALSSWGWRMQEGVSNDLYAAAQQFEENPTGYASAAEAIRKKWSDELPADPKTREIFDKSFVNQNQAYTRNINAQHEKKLREEQLASFSAGYSSRLVDFERQAQVLGANPDGDAIVAEQTRTIQNSIDGAAAGAFSRPPRRQSTNSTWQRLQRGAGSRAFMMRFQRRNKKRLSPQAYSMTGKSRKALLLPCPMTPSREFPIRF